MRNWQFGKTFARWLQSWRAQTACRGISTLSDERGQAIVIIALAMIALIAFAGLVFDGGTAYAERRRMQNAAEAGALSGAYKLAFGLNSTNQDICHAISEYTLDRNGQARYGGQITDFTAYYIDQNGNQVAGQQLIVQACGNPGNPPLQAVGVVVTATTTFNTFFMNVLGMQVGSVNAQAKAIFAPVNNIPNNLWPIAPKCAIPNPSVFAQCGFTQTPPGGPPIYYNLWEGGGSGNFGWLTWNNSTSDPNCAGGGVGVPLLCNNVRHPETMQYTNPNNPLDHTVSVGDAVNGLTGVKNSSNIVAALNSIVASGTPISVPIWGTSSGSGSNLTYNIVAFGTFVLTGFYLPQGVGGGGGTQSGNANLCFTGGLANGSGACIVGYFITYAKVNSAGDPCLQQYACTPVDTGTRTVSIIGP